MRFFRKKLLILPLVFIAIVVLGDLILVFSTHGKSMNIEIVSLGKPVSSVSKDQIKVMTVNMAHGRGSGKSQILQSSDSIENNVTAIGHLIAREEARVVALQEADSASW